MRKLALALLLLFVLPGLVTGSTYTERKERGRALTTQINQVRAPADLYNRYLLIKIADQRAAARAAEYEATGTAEFPHRLGRVINAMEAAGWDWCNVGEVVGFSNELDTRTITTTADSIVDRWWASSSHRTVLNASRYRWGGGSWHVSDRNGVIFFAYYVVDPC